LVIGQKKLDKLVLMTRRVITSFHIWSEMIKTFFFLKRWKLKKITMWMTSCDVKCFVNDIIQHDGWPHWGHNHNHILFPFGVIFVPYSFYKKRLHMCKFSEVLEKKLEAKGYIPFWINFHLYFEISYFIHTKAKSWVVCANEFLGRSIMSVGDCRPFGDPKKLNICGEVVSVMLVFWVFLVSISCFGKHPVLSPTWKVVPCHQQMERLLNSCHNSCTQITKLKIHVVRFVHIHLWLLGVQVFIVVLVGLLVHFQGVKGFYKLCAIGQLYKEQT